jgi:hypothetical protein
MHDGIGFGKIKWVILGHELNENNVRKLRIRSHRSQRHVAV